MTLSLSKVREQAKLPQAALTPSVPFGQSGKRLDSSGGGGEGGVREGRGGW